MSNQGPLRLLIVDEQPGVRALCAAIGHAMGLVCSQAESADEGLERVGNDAPELMLADLLPGKSSGLELLAEVKKRSPQTEVALMSAYGTIESAVRAMRLGAYDFVVKPFRAEEFGLVLKGMVEKVRLTRDNEGICAPPGGAHAAYEPPVLSTDLGELERFTVRRVFEQVDGDKEKAQKLLGISRATLYRKLKRYGIQTRPFRQQPVDTEQKTDAAAERMILLSQS
jgi:DNA-binding NtrC family response regulator